MIIAAFRRAPVAAKSPAPIKNYTLRGFIIGWVAIVALGAAGYGFAASQLVHSGIDSAAIHIAETNPGTGR